MIALFVEIVAVLHMLVNAAPQLTLVGVAYLIVVDRRRARTIAQLETTARLLVTGHTGDAASHRELAVTLKENPHHVH